MSGAAVAGPVRSDRTVLLELYRTRGGVEWDCQEGWKDNASDLDTWFGVTDNGDGRVVILQLEGSWKRFNLDRAAIYVSGAFPSEIHHLDALTTLNLSGNRMTGEIPMEVCELRSLTALKLANNDLTGSIPPGIKKLVALKTLDVSHNFLTGSIPAGIKKLVALKTLDVSDNRLTGSIPLGISMLVALETLNVSWNQLKGGIEFECSGLVVLEALGIDGCVFADENGYNFSKILKLPFLTTLKIANYTPTGGRLSELSNIRCLTSLEITNHGIGDTLDIPSDLWTLVNLTTLRLKGKGWSGSLSSEVCRLTALRELRIRYTQLTGSIPSEIGGMSSVTSLDLSKNGLTGSIPSEIGGMSSVTSLDLSYNRLTVPAESQEEHKDPEQETPLPQSTAIREDRCVGNVLQLLLGCNGGRLLMDVLPFITCPGFCQCLLVDRALCKGVRSYLSTLVVSPEESQGWTVPVDVLRIAPRKIGDRPPRLVSATCGVSIEGPEESLQRLNALLVPEPIHFDVGSKTYISLAPVLRCRWNGDASEGPWVVHFSFPGLGGFDQNFSNLVSVFRRPAGSPGGAWELLDRVDDEDDESDGDKTVSVTVSHFSDVLAAVKLSTLSEKSKGYIIKPFRNAVRRQVSTTVRLHNLSKERLSYFQYWPYSIRRSTTGGAQVMGTGASGGGEYQLRDPMEEIGAGDVDAWPRDPSTNKLMAIQPEPQKLDTQRQGMKLHLVVYTGALQQAKVLAEFECNPGYCVVLLEGIESKTVPDAKTKKAVRAQLNPDI